MRHLEGLHGQQRLVEAADDGIGSDVHFVPGVENSTSAKDCRAYGGCAECGQEDWGQDLVVRKAEAFGDIRQMEEGRDGIHFEGTDMSHLSTVGKVFELYF